jgi:hypothetical protein
MSETPSKKAAPKKTADPEAVLAAKVLKAKNPHETLRKEGVVAERMWGWARDGHWSFEGVALQLLNGYCQGVSVDMLLAVAARLPEDALSVMGFASALQGSYREAPERWEAAWAELPSGAQEILVLARVTAGVPVDAALRERVLDRYAGFVVGDKHTYIVSLIDLVAPLEGRDAFLERVRRLHTPEREAGRRPRPELLEALRPVPWAVLDAVIQRHPYLLGEEALTGLIEARGDAAADVYATYARHRDPLAPGDAWLILRLAAARGEVAPEVESLTVAEDAPSTPFDAAAIAALPAQRRAAYVTALKESGARSAEASELFQDPALDEALIEELVALARKHDPQASPRHPNNYELALRLYHFAPARRHGISLMTRAYERYLPHAQDALQARFVRWAIARATFRASAAEVERPVDLLGPGEDIAFVYDPTFVHGGTDLWASLRPDELTRLYALWAAEDWDGTLGLDDLAAAAGRTHVVPPIEERPIEELARLVGRTSGVRLAKGERDGKTVTRALARLNAAKHPAAAELRARL